MNEISRDELQLYQKKYHADYSVGDLAYTVCALSGLPEPKDNGGALLKPVIELAAERFGAADKNQRTFIHCPDAVGDIHYQKHPELLCEVEKRTDLKLLSTVVFPSVTPVCFCTMFSGASPEVHGIKKWEQPIVEVETIFDLFAAAGKSVAIVARDSSMARIFRKRKIDYYTTRCDDITRRITRRLIAEDEYDLIVSYTWCHDHFGHLTSPNSPESLEALKYCVESFVEYSELIEKYWKKYNRTVIWAPDHGNHAVDEKTGSHGKDIPEDMLVNHFYRVAAGVRD